MSHGDEDIRIDPITGEILPAAAEVRGMPPNVVEYTVSDISTAIRRTMEDTFGHVRVRGEVGRVSRPASGHVYLDLKDERSVLAAVIWRGVAGRLKIQPEQGMEVVATGRITTYAGQSKYQLVIERLEPAGIGALMALLEERRRKLAAEGLFDTARKKPLPWLPEVIGVITSPTGAVIRDILHRLADRFPRHVIVWPVRVQGETCAMEVARAIAGFNALPADGSGPVPRPDLIIVARGGGSLEDLWGFNEEMVVRAAAASDIPLISAVGHETDTTLIDLAADWRAPTPTAAAEKAVPVRAELLAWTQDLGVRLLRSMQTQAEHRRQRLLAATRALPRPEDILALAQQRLDVADARLRHALAELVAERRRHLAQLQGRLSPMLLHHRAGLARQGLQSLSLRLAQAAEGAWQQRRQALQQLQARLSLRPFRQHLQHQRQQLEVLGRRLWQAQEQRLVLLHQQLATLAGRQAQTLHRQLPQRRERLQQLARTLESLNPKAVLARGYALVHDAEAEGGAVGRLMTRAADIHPAQRLMLEFHDGQRLVQAVPARDEGRKTAVHATTGRRVSAGVSSAPRRKDDENGQPSLFAPESPDEAG